MAAIARVHPFRHVCCCPVFIPRLTSQIPMKVVSKVLRLMHLANVLQISFLQCWCPAETSWSQRGLALHPTRCVLV